MKSSGVSLPGSEGMFNAPTFPTTADDVLDAAPLSPDEGVSTPWYKTRGGKLGLGAGGVLAGGAGLYGLYRLMQKHKMEDEIKREALRELLQGPSSEDFGE